MKHQDKHHKTFLSYLFVVLGLFILALFAYPFYQESIIKSEERSSLQSEYSKQSDRLKELQRIHSLIQEQDSEIFQRIENLSQDFSQDDILEYIHDYTRSLPGRSNIMVLREVGFGSTELTDIGFSKTHINLSFVVSNEATLLKFFEYLIDDTQKYRFYIPSFNYELGELQGSFAVQVPLVLYHR